MEPVRALLGRFYHHRFIVHVDEMPSFSSQALPLADYLYLQLVHALQVVSPRLRHLQMLLLKGCQYGLLEMLSKRALYLDSLPNDVLDKMTTKDFAQCMQQLLRSEQAAVADATMRMPRAVHEEEQGDEVENDEDYDDEDNDEEEEQRERWLEICKSVLADQVCELIQLLVCATPFLHISPCGFFSHSVTLFSEYNLQEICERHSTAQ